MARLTMVFTTYLFVFYFLPLVLVFDLDPAFSISIFVVPIFEESHTHHEVVHQWIEPCSVELLLPGVGRLRGRQRGGHQRASVQGEGNNPRFSQRPGQDSGRVLRDHPWSTGGGYG
jgi:hypothetical protein